MPETTNRNPLGRELAQRVLDRVAPALHHNVNVMDRTGIIIASRDASRLGTVHQAALAVAATGEPGIIYPGDESAGVLPGVNLPLVFEDAILGVVGVTGNPSQVRPVAEVLVLAIGLLISRERELDASARREARDLDLISSLVNGRPDSGLVAGLLAHHTPMLRGPWRLSAVIAEPDTVIPEFRPDALPGCRHASFGGALWILGRGGDDTGKESDTLDAFGSARVIVGESSSDIEELRGAAGILGLLVANADLLPPEKKRFAQGELSIELSVACLPSAAADHLAAKVGALSAGQIHTLQSFLDAGCSLAATSRLLYTHRNTVIQRIERIMEITGLDPREPATGPTLRLALVAARRKPTQ